MRPRCSPRALGLVLVALAAQPLHSQQAQQSQPSHTISIAGHVAEASQRFGIPEHWIYAVIRAESAGRVGAVSSAGAMGLMQLMPGTWARQRARFRLGSDPFDPRDNILAGTSYLREMYDLYGSPGFLAAYNAGPGRYRDWRDRARPLPAETRAYVARIAPMLQAEGAPNARLAVMPAQTVRLSWADAPLFARSAQDTSDAPLAAINGTSANTPPASSPVSENLFAPVTGPRSQ